VKREADSVKRKPGKIFAPHSPLYTLHKFRFYLTMIPGGPSGRRSD
jgi:hypothetical protein